MTLPKARPSGIPELTEQIAREAFPKVNVHMRMRDELGEMYKDEDFQDLYGKSGGWAESPGRLALVSIMQYAENLTDRQAADAVRGRIVCITDILSLFESGWSQLNRTVAGFSAWPAFTQLPAQILAVAAETVFRP